MKVGIVFGTRPEAIKVAPVYHELKNNGIDVKAVVTGQHKEMLYQVLDLFEIKPDYDLEIMRQGQGLSELTGRLMLKLDEIMKKEKFDYVLVQGDTTSVLTGALSAFYNQIPVGHIEAGLRTGNIYSPFPEEANRKLVGTITDIHFAPTDVNVDNLLKEGYSKEKILKVGNTVIDALHIVVDKIKNDGLLREDTSKMLRDAGYDVSRLCGNRRLVLVTGHRRENFGEGFLNICRALKDLVEKYSNVDFVYPMHLNPNVRKPIHEVFGDNLKVYGNMFFIEPLEYLAFVYLMEKSTIVLTDSGGIQEEAPGLGKPVLVMRDTTERPEALEAGTVRLVGTDYNKIMSGVSVLLEDKERYQEMSRAVNPYGDGRACDRIINVLK